MTQPIWYNAERVKQPGSVILTEWRAKRQVSASNDVQQNLTTQELVNILAGGVGSAGPAVTETTAMRVSAVYACVALIAGAISTLPMHTYARIAEGRERTAHDYWWLLNEQPNEEMSAAVFWEYMVSARLFYGDCFAEIVRPNYYSNRVTGFKPLHPLRVQPFRDSAGRLFYRVTPLIGAQYVLNPADIIHVPSLGYDGLRSPSPITHAARQAIATSLSANEYNANFFTNGARPDFALKVPAGAEIDEEQAKLIRATWGEHHSGVAKSHLPAVLTGGIEVQQLTMSAADSQILNTSILQIEEIARTLGVPPHLIGHTSKVTSWGAGVEQMGRGFVKFTLRRDLKKFEQEFNRKLWPIRERYFVEFDVSDLERGDLKSENEALRIAVGRAGEPGWMTPNEVRNVKLMPPIEGGDKLNDGIGKPADPKPEPNLATTGTEDDAATETAGE